MARIMEKAKPIKRKSVNRRLPIRHHSRERGTAIFVTTMAVVLLTGLGTWVVYASGLAASGAGNQRAGTQALHLAELGVLAGTAHMAQENKARQLYKVAKANQTSGDQDDCQSVPAGVSNPFCMSVWMEDIDTDTVAETTYTVLDLAAAQGSMGPYAGVTQGHFRLEVSDARPFFTAGSDLNKPAPYREVSISSYGMVRPANAGVCAGADSQNSAATMLGMRAKALIGPLD